MIGNPGKSGHLYNQDTSCRSPSVRIIQVPLYIYLICFSMGNSNSKFILLMQKSKFVQKDIDIVSNFVLMANLEMPIILNCVRIGVQRLY